jgi:hypothetical protein
MVGLTLLSAPISRAQDAVTDERLKKLSGDIEALMENQKVLSEEMTSLRKELNEMRSQLDKPAPTYASHEDLARLAKSIEEVDRKRMEDNKKIGSDIANLGKKLLSAPPPVAPHVKSTPPPSDGAEQDTSSSVKGWTHTVEPGDSLTAIIAAYNKDKKIKLTIAKVLKANPGLKPEPLIAGKKIFLPAQ